MILPKYHIGSKDNINLNLNIPTIQSNQDICLKKKTISNDAHNHNKSNHSIKEKKTATNTHTVVCLSKAHVIERFEIEWKKKQTKKT